jgi:hypothetical protein
MFQMFQMFLPFGPERTRLARPEQCHFAGANLKPAGGPFLDADRRFTMSPRFSVTGDRQDRANTMGRLLSKVQVPWGSGTPDKICCSQTKPNVGQVMILGTSLPSAFFLLLLRLCISCVFRATNRQARR